MATVLLKPIDIIKFQNIAIRPELRFLFASQSSVEPSKGGLR
jgi:hypothetical protein